MEPDDRQAAHAPPSRREKTPAWLMWVVVPGGWALVLLLFMVEAYISNWVSGRPMVLERVLVPYSLAFALWAALTPVVAACVHRFPVEAPHRLRNLAVQFVTGAVLAVGHIALFVWVRTALGLYAGPALSLRERFLKELPGNILVGALLYAVVAAVFQGVRYCSAIRARELAALELEGRLARVQLEALRTQLHPHFLFNTLHAISALMQQDVRAARRMIAQLSDLLRLSLEGDGLHLVPLRAELEFLSLYLDIQRTRFGDRLSVEYSVEPDTLGAEVPRLILQPLVENAVRHGIEPRAAPGRVEIHARRCGAHLCVEIRDDGVGLCDGPEGRREGIGLGNTRARLERLYGERHRFELTSRPGGGVLAAFEIPFALHAPSARPR